MVGAIIGAAAQIGSTIYGAVKSSQANKRAEDLIRSQRDENRKWYEEKMSEDYTQRADVQNILRKQRDLFEEQYKRARATNLVAGGTDESLALQQAQANEAMGETMSNIAAQSTSYKEAVENQYRNQDAALNQQQAGLEQNKANTIASAAGQMGSAVSGLVQGGMGKEYSSSDSAPSAGKALGGTTTFDSYAKADAKAKLGSGPTKLKI